MLNGTGAPFASPPPPASDGEAAIPAAAVRRARVGQGRRRVLPGKRRVARRQLGRVRWRFRRRRAPAIANSPQGDGLAESLHGAMLAEAGAGLPNQRQLRAAFAAAFRGPVAHRKLAGDGRRDAGEDLRDLGSRLADHDRRPLVAGAADRGHQRVFRPGRGCRPAPPDGARPRAGRSPRGGRSSGRRSRSCSRSGPAPGPRPAATSPAPSRRR